MMRHKNEPVLPQNCIVHILDLIAEEEHADAKGSGLVGEHARFVTSPGHGPLFASCGIQKTGTNGGKIGYSQQGHDYTAKPIGADVSGQNQSIGFFFQQGLHVLEFFQNQSDAIFDGKQNRHRQSGLFRNGRVGRFAVKGVDRQKGGVTPGERRGFFHLDIFRLAHIFLVFFFFCFGCVIIILLILF